MATFAIRSFGICDGATIIAAMIALQDHPIVPFREVDFYHSSDRRLPRAVTDDAGGDRILDGVMVPAAGSGGATEFPF